jgi:hypothetical protein
MLVLLLRVEPELAASLIKEWTGWDAGMTELDLDTEVFTRSGRFVDIEIALKCSPRKWIWIEIKRDLPGESSEGQVAAYVEDLSKECHGDEEGCVVYLPRPGVRDPKPPETPSVAYRATDWTEVGTWLQESPWAKRPFVADFLNLLREETLFMERIDPNEINGLDRRSPRRFAALIEEARERIALWAERAPGVDSERGGFGPSQSITWVTNWGERTNATFPLEPDVGKNRPLLLEWNLRKRDEGLHVGEVVFAAGLTWWDMEASGWHDLASRIEQQTVASGKPPFSRYDDDCHRLYKWLEPADLAQELSFEDQIEALRDFVVGSFDDLLVALRDS